VAGWTGLAAADATGPAAADFTLPGVKTNYIRDATNVTLGKVGDLAQVASARFYVSADKGATWTLLADVPVAAGATAAPRYRFRPDHDGFYLIVTSKTLRNGTAEPLPAGGTIPRDVLAVYFDATPPVLTKPLDARIVSVASDHAVVAVAWSWADGAFGKDCAAVDASGDDGATFPVLASGQAVDQVQITVPLAKGAKTVQLRAHAADRAGNLTSAPLATLTLPVPVDPVQNLVKAVTALPAVDELQVAAPAPRAPSASAAATTGALTGPVPVPGASATVPVATASADPNRPDIVVAGDTATDGAVIAGSSIEDAYNLQVAKASGLRQATPRPGDQDVSSAPAPAPAPAPADSDDGAHPYIPNPAAGDLLAQANAKAAAGDRVGALELYKRLYDSSVADAAVAAELNLLWTGGANQAILDTADALPPELASDTVRLYRGRALVALGRHDQAVTVLKTVHAGAPEAREALFLIGQCFKVQGRAEQAQRIFAHLAKGNDDIAKQAQAQL
jgi:hypothetical protein